MKIGEPTAPLTLQFAGFLPSASVSPPFPSVSEVFWLRKHFGRETKCRKPATSNRHLPNLEAPPPHLKPERPKIRKNHTQFANTNHTYLQKRPLHKKSKHNLLKRPKMCLELAKKTTAQNVQSRPDVVTQRVQGGEYISARRWGSC